MWREDRKWTGKCVLGGISGSVMPYCHLEEHTERMDTHNNCLCFPALSFAVIVEDCVLCLFLFYISLMDDGANKTDGLHGLHVLVLMHFWFR